MADAALAIDLAHPETPSFSDVPSDDPYYEHVEGAHLAGLIKGVGGGLFAPASTLTREQAVGIVARKVAADQTSILAGCGGRDSAASEVSPQGIGELRMGRDGVRHYPRPWSKAPAPAFYSQPR